MSDNKKRPYTVTVEITPAHPPTAQERAEYARDRERAEYHSEPRPEFDTVNLKNTSFILSDTFSTKLSDGRGNVATTSLNTLTRESSTSLVCKDGRKLPEYIVERAIEAVIKDGPTKDGWFSDDYQSKGINPLESACRADHNRRAHKGREPD